jgi:hypothetical protein
MKYYLFFLLFLVLTSLTKEAGSQEVKYDTPYNSSYLAKYGISPKIFNILLSPMYQEEVKFSANWTLNEKTAGKENQIAVQMGYDPYYAYGNQLYVVVGDPETYDYMSKGQIKKYISRHNEKFKKLKEFSLIEEGDVGFIKEIGDTTILGFKFNKSRLPRKIRYYHKFEGRIYLYKGQVSKITLTASEKFKSIGIKYHNFYAEAKFKGNQDTGLLLDSYAISGTGIKKGGNYSFSEKFDIVSYKNQENKILSDYSSNQPSEQEHQISDTLTLKLERALPFLGNAARKAGYELPLPWGVNLFSHFQNESFSLTNIVLNDVNLSELAFKDGNSIADIDIGVTAAMGDVWILPFLNFSALYGRIYGSTKVSLALNDEMKDLLGLDGKPVDQLDFNVDVGGTIAGLGITLAGGYKNFFATVATQYIVQTTESAGTTVKAFVITPLVGLRMPKIVNIMVGAQYQSMDTKIAGGFELDGENNNFSLTLVPKSWNFMVGVQRDISNHWSGAFQVGIGNRKSSTLVVGYRF